MPESVLTVLKFCFLALLYLFLFQVVRVVYLELRAPALAAEPAAAPPAPQGRERGRERGGLRLRIVEPSSLRGETFAVTDEVTVGRGGGCGIVLADDHFVSTVHARLFRRDGHLYVEDLGSRNGTFLNGHPVGEAARLRRGDLVQFGETVAEVVR